MPRFDFRCRQCGKLFEVSVESHVQTYPCSCSSKGFPGIADKQVSAPAFVVKGYSAANGYSKGGE